MPKNEKDGFRVSDDGTRLDAPFVDTLLAAVFSFPAEDAVVIRMRDHTDPDTDVQVRMSSRTARQLSEHLRSICDELDQDDGQRH